MKNLLRYSLAALLATTAVYAAAATSAVAEAKARMRERVAAIDKLKLAEAVGENNKGLLEVRKAGDEANAVVAAENKDRTEVFADTARSAGSSADAVGKAFARQLAAASAPGVWLQKEDGVWYKK